MNETQLKDVILTALKQIAPEPSVDQLSPDDNLREMLDLDSFDHLNFLIGLNTKLGVDIPEKDYGKLNTLADIMEYLAVKVA
jgi:acyl carrier protein